MGLSGIKHWAKNADDGAKVLTLAANNGGTSDLDIFTREIGLDFSNEISKKTVQAFTDPMAALTSFQTDQEKVAKDAALEYKRYYSDLINSNVPIDVATTTARANAQDYFNRRMEVVKIQHPYADSAEKLINLAKGHARMDILPKPNAGGQGQNAGGGGQNAGGGGQNAGAGMGPAAGVVGL